MFEDKKVESAFWFGVCLVGTFLFAAAFSTIDTREGIWFVWWTGTLAMTQVCSGFCSSMFWRWFFEANFPKLDKKIKDYRVYRYIFYIGILGFMLIPVGLFIWVTEIARRYLLESEKERR